MVTLLCYIGLLFIQLAVKMRTYWFFGSGAVGVPGINLLGSVGAAAGQNRSGPAAPAAPTSFNAAAQKKARAAQGKKKQKTNGWKCAGDVLWGAAEATFIGTVLALGAEALANPDHKYSGNNANGRKIQRGNVGHARAVARGVGKAGLIGLVVGGAIGAGAGYAGSKNCPDISE
jgi:hypothetical protein